MGGPQPSDATAGQGPSSETETTAVTQTIGRVLIAETVPRHAGRPVGAKAPRFRYVVQWTEPWSRTRLGERVVDDVGAYLSVDGALAAFGEELRRNPAVVGDGYRLRIVDRGRGGSANPEPVEAPVVSS